ncbi:MAG TPA: cupin domain-containing protein [Gaiellaceae bacterium]
MNRPQASSTVQVDNEHVRVTEWRFAPGEATGWHRHELDYVIVPVVGGTIQLESASGSDEAELVPGRSYFREAGVEHDVVNAGGAEVVFVEIELKP